MPVLQNTGMSLLESNEKLVGRACSHAKLVDGALKRISMSSSLILRHTDTTGDSVVISTEKLSCDFSDAAVLMKYNQDVVPGLRELVQETERRGMTAVRQIFSMQAMHALSVVGDVTSLTYDEITQILAPRSAEGPNGLGQVLSFPARRR